MYFPGKIGQDQSSYFQSILKYNLLGLHSRNGQDSRFKIQETVMNCDDDYVKKPEKYKCLGNTIDGHIFNKHNDQEKKTLVKRIFFTCMEFIQFKLLCFNLIL